MNTEPGRNRLDLDDLHRMEAEFFDDLARRRPVNLDLPISADTAFPYVSRAGARAVDEFLGDLSGLRALDCGCGTGFVTVLLARKGARVSAFDISPQHVDITRRRVEKNGVSHRIDRIDPMSLETIDFPDDSFDIVYGGHILHHTRLDLSVPQVARVLRSPGKAVFVETLATNRPLIWVRRHLAGRFGIPRLASQNEFPLRPAELDWIASRFKSFHLRGDILFAMLAEYAFRGRRVARLLRAADSALFDRIPRAARLAYAAILFLQK
jgi:SAM-dependent methyltransferase